MKQLEKEREETRRLESDLAGKNGDMETLIEQIKVVDCYRRTVYNGFLKMLTHQ